MWVKELLPFGSILLASRYVDCAPRAAVWYFFFLLLAAKLGKLTDRLICEV